MIGQIVGWLVGGGINAISQKLLRAYEMKIMAETSEQKLAAELDIERLEAQMHVAQLANEDRWSATSLGRYLIVLPFGAWWTAIFLDSIFTFEWDVLALPPAILEMSWWLIPAIVIGDVGRSIFRRR